MEEASIVFNVDSGEVRKQTYSREGTRLVHETSLKLYWVRNVCVHVLVCGVPCHRLLMMRMSYRGRRK